MRTVTYDTSYSTHTHTHISTPTERSYILQEKVHHTIGPIPTRWSWVGGVKKTEILGLKSIQLLRFGCR